MYGASAKVMPGQNGGGVQPPVAPTFNQWDSWATVGILAGMGVLMTTQGLASMPSMVGLVGPWSGILQLAGWLAVAVSVGYLSYQYIQGMVRSGWINTLMPGNPKWYIRYDPILFGVFMVSGTAYLGQIALAKYSPGSQAAAWISSVSSLGLGLSSLLLSFSYLAYARPWTAGL